MRLIDADALLKDINDYPYGYRRMIKDTIAKQPTVEPKHGHWVMSNGDYEWECSSCGEGLSNYKTAYCPDCGAKMEKNL